VGICVRGAAVMNSFIKRFSFFLFCLFFTFSSLADQKGISQETASPPGRQLSKIDRALWPAVETVRALEGKSLRSLAPTERSSWVSELGRVSPAWRAGQMMIDDLGRVQVYLSVEQWNETLRQRLIGLGVRVEIEKPERAVVQCSIPADRLETVAALEGVRAICRPVYAETARRILEGTNAIRHEGDSLHRFDTFREQTGLDGTGYSVGVISDGILRIAESQAAGELPASVTAESFRADGDLNYGGEGTAILEQCYDSMPGASLYFANAYTDLEMVEAVNWLAEHCDAIVCDMVFTGIGPADGGGFLDRAISKAAREILTFSCAVGNGADDHYRGVFWDPNGDGWHNFSASRDYVVCSIRPGGTLYATLFWDDHFLIAQKNLYSMRLNRLDTGAPLESSDAIKMIAGREPELESYQKRGYPSETLFYTNNESERLYCKLYIQGWSVEPRLLDLFISGNAGGSLEDFIVPEGSLPNVAIAKGVRTSGAYHSGTACTRSGADAGEDAIGTYAFTIEPYSSFGSTSDGRSLPNTCYPDRITTYSDFWNWKMKGTEPDYSVGGGGGTSLCTENEAALGICSRQYEVNYGEDGSASFTVGNQNVTFSGDLFGVQNLNTCMAANASGMQLFITAGDPSPDMMEAKDLIALASGVRYSLQVEPQEYQFYTTPGVGEETTLKITNPHGTLDARGWIRFDPRSLLLKLTNFQIPPGESLAFRVATNPTLGEGRYRSKIHIGYLGMENPIAIPVEIVVQTTPNDRETAIAEVEPNSAVQFTELFTLSQAIPLPESTEENPGEPLLRITGTVSTEESGYRPHTFADDVEDWFRFELQEPTTMAFCVVPDSASADLDLYVMKEDRTLYGLDRDRDGWAETLGPVALSAGRYALGVGLYDFNFPNEDGTYEPYDTTYELTVQSSPTGIASSTDVSTFEVVALGGNAVYLGRQGEDTMLFGMDGASWTPGLEIAGHFCQLKKVASGSTKVGVVSDENPSGTATSIQSLRIYDFQNIAAPALDATLAPSGDVTTREIKDYAFSAQGAAAVLHVESTLPGGEQRHELVALDAATGSELSRIDLGVSGRVRFDTYPNKAFATFQSPSPLSMVHVDATDASPMQEIVTFNISRPYRHFTTVPEGDKAYYISVEMPETMPKSKLYTVDLSTGQATWTWLTSPPSHVEWSPDGSRFVVVGPSSSLAYSHPSLGRSYLTYPDIGTGGVYHPQAPVFLADATVAMPIDNDAIMLANVETGEVLRVENVAPNAIVDLAANSSGTRLYIAGDEAAALDVTYSKAAGVALKKARKKLAAFSPESLPQLCVYPNIIGFANLGSGVASASQAVRIYNTGRVAAHVYGMSWVGDADSFRLENPISATAEIEPGQWYSLQVTARPSRPGLQQALLRMMTDNRDDPNRYLLMSVSGKPGTGDYVAGDADADGKIGFPDLAQMSRFWGQSRAEVDPTQREKFDQSDADFSGEIDPGDVYRMKQER